MGSTSAPGEDTVTILVTGFGPFHDKFPTNPSYEIVKQLPSTLPAVPGHATAINLIAHPSPIRVAYSEVRTLVPALLASHAATVDLVLHIGMASGRANYSLERLAHRDGYSAHADVDGARLPPDAGSADFPDCKHILTTTLEYDEVLAGWQRNLVDAEPGAAPGAPPLVRADESNDPGHYLCDYIYFNSLAWFARRKRQEAGGDADTDTDTETDSNRVGDRPVLFLHVPGESDAVTLRKGVVAATALLRSMADSWKLSKRYEESLRLPERGVDV